MFDHSLICIKLRLMNKIDCIFDIYTDIKREYFRNSGHVIDGSQKPLSINIIVKVIDSLQYLSLYNGVIHFICMLTLSGFN